MPIGEMQKSQCNLPSHTDRIKDLEKEISCCKIIQAFSIRANITEMITDLVADAIKSDGKMDQIINK